MSPDLYLSPSTTENDFIPLHAPCLSGEEWKYVKECLDTGWISSAGPMVEKFENVMAQAIGLPHVIATTSGTAALHVALHALGIGSGDAVIIPSLTFIATANAVRYTGAQPIFLDVEATAGTLCPDSLEQFLSNETEIKSGQRVHPATGLNIKAIMPVHLLGHPAQMERLKLIAYQYGILLIEDAAQALGTKYQGRHVGHHGTAACFSFNGNKIMSCGSGGIVATADAGLADRIRFLSTQAKADPKNYIHNEMGFNYRFNSLLAGVGLAQMEVFAERLQRKREILAYYEASLADVAGLFWPQEEPDAERNAWLCTVHINAKDFGMSNMELRDTLEKQKIQTRLLWEPMHHSKAHQDFYATSITQANHWYQVALSLPSSAHLSRAEQDRVIAAIRQASLLATHMQGAVA